MALFLASLIGTAVSTGGGHFPSPYDPVATLQAFVAQYPAALAVGATLQFASAIPLAIFTAVAVARLHHLGARAPGVTIALVGGGSLRRVRLAARRGRAAPPIPSPACRH